MKKNSICKIIVFGLLAAVPLIYTIVENTVIYY